MAMRVFRRAGGRRSGTLWNERWSPSSTTTMPCQVSIHPDRSQVARLLGPLALVRLQGDTPHRSRVRQQKQVAASRQGRKGGGSRFLVLQPVLKCEEIQITNGQIVLEGRVGLVAHLKLIQNLYPNLEPMLN